ncbi:hypothetical protein AC249_AIPGENE9706 [Exaiptasia diaphana]|nr:hypothetical protein AC249_AIPGENE9706 [Exaiptasia diaphana]
MANQDSSDFYRSMAFVKVKSVYMHDEGLQLEEHDVDKVVFCPEALKQLLMIETPRNMTPVNNPSIPSSKATRFGGSYKNTWNLPKLACERNLCRSADFYELSQLVSTHARFYSEPDLPGHSTNSVQTFSFVKPKRTYFSKDFILEGKTFLPRIEAPCTGKSYIKPGNYNVDLTNNIRPCISSGREEQVAVELPPLSARKCFPNQSTKTVLQEDTRKIKPMKRNLAIFNKYFQSRFGRNIDQTRQGNHLSETYDYKEKLGLLGDKWKRDPGEGKRNAPQNVVEQILRPADNYNKDYSKCNITLEGSLQCTGLKLE